MSTANRDPYPAIAGTRRYSEQKLSEVQVGVDALDLPPGVLVVVTGSYGRLEASDQSDFDYYLVSNGTSEGDKHWIADIDALVSRLGIRAPAADGVFGKSIDISEMTDTIGGQDDSNASITLRMLFLLEGRAAGRAALMDDYRQRLIGRYINDRIAGHQLALFFLNDVIRYYRTICVDYEYKVTNQGKGWAIRNIKLAFSRKLLYFGGVLAAAEVAHASAPRKRESLNQLLGMAPIDRLLEVCGPAANRALALYDRFLAELGKPDVRAALDRVGPDNRKDDPVFRDLKDLSYRFDGALMQILQATYDRAHPIHRALVL